MFREFRSCLDGGYLSFRKFWNMKHSKFHNEFKYGVGFLIKRREASDSTFVVEKSKKRRVPSSI